MIEDISMGINAEDFKEIFICSNEPEGRELKLFISISPDGLGYGSEYIKS